MSFPQNTGSFVPVSNVWDVSQIADSNLDPALKELLIRLYQNINLISINLNLKDTGYYPQSQFVNGQLFFPNPTTTPSTSMPATYRQVQRQAYYPGALPNNSTLQYRHGITWTANTSFVRIYGASTNPSTKSIPLPYVSTTDVAHNIELWVDPTYINIKTGANYSSYTVTYVVLEWLQM